MSLDHPTPPREDQLRSQERAALIVEYAELTEFCEAPVISQADLRESGPEIAEFEGMVVSFEITYSIEALHSIIDLTKEEAPNHPVREPARIAVGLISQKLTILRTETDISSVKCKELEREYWRLSAAVGIINDNKVDHELRV